MIYRKLIFLLLFLFLCGGAATALATNLTATPDRTVIGEDETLQLSVRIDEQIGFGGPDFSMLEEHFEILNQHRSNQFRSINGRTEGWTEWNIILAPKRTGKLLIPSFSFEGAISDAVEITVNSASTAPAGEVKELFTEMEVSKDSIYVQEQLLVTYRIFSAVQVREISLAEAFNVENANVEAVSETNFRKTINGQVYRAYEVVYAIHPQKSEPLQIPGLTWNLVTAGTRANWFNDPFRSSRGQVRRLRTEPRTIEVKPSPASYSGVDWIPATAVTLEQHWSSDPNRFVVGEPITRTLTLSAKGLTASQIPAIPQINNADIKVYSDQPQFDETKSRDGIDGVRIETSAIVPTKAGSINLPPIRVTWWDTINNREQVAELPAQLINVAPAALGLTGSQPDLNTQPSQAAEDSDTELSSSKPWLQWQDYWPLLLSNAVFALLSVGLLVAWLSAKHKPINNTHSQEPSQANESLAQLARNIRLACSENKPLQAKQALGKWGQAYFNLAHIASLQEISQHCRSKAVETELKRLDQHLYSARSQQTWNGRALWQALSRFIKQRGQASQTTKDKGSLKPLYPNAA